MSDTTDPNLVAGISVEDLRVAFAPDAVVLDNLSLAVEPGEIVALLGPSGCGKSTLLRCIAQLLAPTSGQIRFSGPSPIRRAGELSFVFQDATLLPWRTVFENVRLPFELGKRGTRRAADSPTANQEAPQESRHSQAVSNRVQSALSSVGLGSDTHKKYPRELSGGMRMRASIARALVTDPSVMLLDEPFAALDDMLRTRLNNLILELWEARRRTIVFVTHNIAEAIYLSHRTAILSGGAITSVLDNPLPWPREPGLRTSVEFAQEYGRVSSNLAEVSVA